MSNPTADLLLHPVRMRIALALSDKQLTAQQLATLLPDVAQATLYRQINKLVEGELLAVVEERPVRGTVERVYALVAANTQLSLEELATLSKDQHMQLFTAFVTSLLGSFNRYLESREQIDLVADGVGYRSVPLYLSDEELAAVSQQLNEALLPVLQNRPGPDRQRRLLTTILMPDVDDPATPET